MGLFFRVQTFSGCFMNMFSSLNVPHFSCLHFPHLDFEIKFNTIIIKNINYSLSTLSNLNSDTSAALGKCLCKLELTDSAS